jgi:hypothetical protein
MLKTFQGISPFDSQIVVLKVQGSTVLVKHGMLLPLNSPRYSDISGAKVKILMIEI